VLHAWIRWKPFVMSNCVMSNCVMSNLALQASAQR
jgi:hypothetical protein